MNIVFMKYCPFIALTTYSGKSSNYSYTGGSEERLSVLKFFHEMGYNVRINSMVYIKDLQWINSDDCKGSRWEWLRDFEYKFYKPIPKGWKPFIEFGTTNLRYTCGEERWPCIYLFNEVIKKYKGNVYFWQGDGNLPIVFHPEKLQYDWVKRDPNTSKFAWARNVDKTFVHNYKTMTKNKHWVVIQRGHKELQDIFLNKNDAPRGQYNRMVKEDKMSIEYIPTGLHYDLIYRKFRKPPKKIKYPLIYIGNQRSRIKRFRQYYEGMGVDTHVFGHWTDAFKDTSKKLVWHDRINQNETWKYYKRAGCTILIGDPLYENLGWWTPRIMESIVNGCPVFVHTEYKNYQELKFPDYFYINDKEEAIKKIGVLTTGVKRSGRIKMVQKQQEAIKQWNIYRWGKTLRRIINKYEGLQLYNM